MWPKVEQIERLRATWTDAWVQVDASRPELARFAGAVGRVKTVNMNGRALVEFSDHFANIGWFDVDPASLTVVPAPVASSAPKNVGSRPAKPKAGTLRAAEASAVSLNRTTHEHARSPA